MRAQARPNAGITLGELRAETAALPADAIIVLLVANGAVWCDMDNATRYLDDIVEPTIGDFQD